MKNKRKYLFKLSVLKGRRTQCDYLFSYSLITQLETVEVKGFLFSFQGLQGMLKQAFLHHFCFLIREAF